jgi:hypothetical protein
MGTPPVSMNRAGEEPGPSVGARPGVADQPKAWPGVTPSFLRIIASGQKPVKADCSRLKPTKAVSQCQYTCVELAQQQTDQDHGAGKGNDEAVDGHRIHCLHFILEFLIYIHAQRSSIGTYSRGSLPT